jgi:peptidoglycan/LPS O-acetylase OafA/YrhL
MTYIKFMANTQAEPKILPLTSARFFVALYVMLYHSVPIIPSQHGRHGALTRIIGLGYIGVPFFFLLSGFILAIVYLKNSTTINKRKFYLARFARIYPLYLMATLLDLPHFLYTQKYVTHRSWEYSLGMVVATGGLIQAWFPSLQGLNPPGWSLSAEAFFYLLFPFIGAALWRMRGKFMGIFAILMYVAGTVLVRFISVADGTMPRQTFNPLGHLYAFVLGICLARLFVWIGADSTRSQTLRRWAPWLLVGSVAAFLAIPILNLPIPELLMQHGVLIPLFALALLALASGNALIFRFFSINWLVVLGEASFALYLIHSPLDSIMRRPIQQYDIPAYLIYIALTIGLSVASLYGLETPAKRWILDKERARLETAVTSVLTA